DQIVGVHPLFSQLLFLFIGAEVRPGCVIKMEISASCIVERTDGFFICCSQITEEVIFIRIDLSVDFTPEMQHARTGYSELRCVASCLFFEIFEIRKEMMVAEIQLSIHFDAPGFCLLFLELYAASGPVPFDTDQIFKKVEMPPGTTKFPVCHSVKADVLLFLDDSCNLFVLHLPQAIRGKLARFMQSACFYYLFRTEQTAHVVGSVYFFCLRYCHQNPLLFNIV